MTRRLQKTLVSRTQEQVHDHHLKAAAHCERASGHHKEAALCMIGGDFRAASSQSQLADEYTGFALLESKQVHRKDTLKKPFALEPTPQQLLFNTIALHEKAIKHYRHASQLYDVGDLRQANTHANIACTHARTALASGDIFVSEDAHTAQLQARRFSA